MAADQRWSKHTLKAKIEGLPYEPTAIAKKPEGKLNLSVWAVDELMKQSDDNPTIEVLIARDAVERSQCPYRHLLTALPPS